MTSVFYLFLPKEEFSGNYETEVKQQLVFLRIVYAGCDDKHADANGFHLPLLYSTSSLHLVIMVNNSVLRGQCQHIPVHFSTTSLPFHIGHLTFLAFVIGDSATDTTATSRPSLLSTPHNFAMLTSIITPMYHDSVFMYSNIHLEYF
jgi:hypothetical protein